MLGNPVRLLDADGKAPEDPPKHYVTTTITQTFRNNKNSRGNNKPSGTDYVRETVSHTVRTSQGVVQITINTTVSIDEDGNLNSIASSTSTVTSYGKDENGKRTFQVLKGSRVEMDISQTSLLLQEKAQSAANFKANNGKSEVQEHVENMNHGVAIAAGVFTTIATSGANMGAMATGAVGIGSGAIVEMSEGVFDADGAEIMLYDDLEIIEK